MKSILLDEKLLGLVEMTSGLVNASFSLPEWQAVKMIFFAPWVFMPNITYIQTIYYYPKKVCEFSHVGISN